MKKFILLIIEKIRKALKVDEKGNSFGWGKGMLLLATLMMVGCEQYVARKAGGTVTIKLNSGQKLIEATWKETNLWYLTEPMDSDYKPKTKVFQENSMYGVFEGTVIFIESKN